MEDPAATVVVVAEAPTLIVNDVRSIFCLITKSPLNAVAVEMPVKILTLLLS